MVRPLEDLVSSARALPWPSSAERVDAVVTWPAPLGGASSQDIPVALAARLGAFLTALARRLDPALLQALERGAHAWDQIDSLTVIDDELRGQAAALSAEWQAVGGPQGTLALYTLDAALDLVRLIERRLATLVRLRLRSHAPGLIVGGRPFLDVAAALAETGKRWAS